MRNTNTEWSVILICEIVFAFVGIIFTSLGIIFAFFIDEIAASPNSYGDVYILPWIFCGLGISLLLVFVALFIISKKQKRSRNQLIKNGQYIYARVTDIKQDLYIRINRQHPFYLICEGVNPYSGEKLYFRSSNIMEYPSRLLGQNLRVFIDYNNPDNYFVEVYRKYD